MLWLGSFELVCALKVIISVPSATPNGTLDLRHTTLGGGRWQIAGRLTQQIVAVVVVDRSGCLADHGLCVELVFVEDGQTWLLLLLILHLNK